MSVFGATESVSGAIEVIDRELNPYTSTFPSEIVTCRFQNGKELRFFCKYSGNIEPERRRAKNYNHKHGITYEAEVYRNIIQPLNVTASRFYGVHTDVTTGQAWLILEHLDHTEKVSSAPNMALATRWIGQFHASNETRLSHAPIPILTNYDAEYYLGWVRRTSLLAGHWHKRFSWLATLCRRFQDILPVLLTSPKTIIHGEYYPNNILVREGIIYPVDWESPAIAKGEIDLAGLTDRWDAKVVAECERQYRQARWPEGAPDDFTQTLAAARLYNHFRWLGERSDWTTQERALGRFQELQRVGEQMGLM